MTDARTEQLREALAATRARIDAACLSSGRDPDGVTLVVVTKTWPAADIARLASLGVRDVGENRDQEARAKAAELPDLRWHFIGQIQTNKAASVASYADLVHAVDRLSLVTALDKGAARAGRIVDCLAEVNLDDPADGSAAGRGGVRPEHAGEIADAIAAAPHLRLRGVMGVAPLGGDAAEAFGVLAATGADLRARHPEADLMSAGMSGDLEQAVAAGATHLRVGSAILGSRPPLG